MKEQFNQEYLTTYPNDWKGEMKQNWIVLLIWSHNTIKMTSNCYGVTENRSVVNADKRTASTLPCPRSKGSHWNAGQMDLAWRLPEGPPPYTSCHPGGKQHHRFSMLVHTRSKSVCPQVLPGHPCSGAGVSTQGLSCGKDQFPSQLTAYPGQVSVQRHANTALTTLLRALL